MAYERNGRDAAGRTLVDDERAVRVARPRRAERVEQQRLGQRVRRVLRRADDVRDAVARVVGGLRVVNLHVLPFPSQRRRHSGRCALSRPALTGQSTPHAVA